MKPLNLDNSPCSPISSNCVIWQGPDIPCIKLCTGDTVSDVVFKLATELCDLLEQLNISTFDLACLNLPCEPKDFHALIQILINKICELEGIPVPGPTPDGNECPVNCIVSVVDCLGGGNDDLVSYVQTIANKICDILDSITTIETNINTLETTVLVISSQVQDLIDNPYTLPDIVIPVGCQIGVYTGPDAVALDTLFEEFLNDWCNYIATASTAAQLAAVLSPDCTLAGSPYFGAAITSDPNWINPATNLADAISNIWTSICFLYNFNYAQTVVTGSGGVVVSSSFDPVTNTTTYDVTTSTPLTSLMPTGAVIPWASPNPTPPIGWLFCDGAVLTSAVYPDLYAVIGQAYDPVLPAGTFRLPNLNNRVPVGKGSVTYGFDLTAVGNAGGQAGMSLTPNQLPPHFHDLTNAVGSVSGTFTGTITGATSTDGTHNHRIWADPNDGIVSGAVDLTGNAGSWYDTGTNNPAGPPDDVYIEDAGSHSHTVTGSASGTISTTLGGTTGDGAPALNSDFHGNMQPYVVMQYIIKI